MTKLRLTEPAQFCSNEKEIYYSASAVDEDGNVYVIRWEITNRFAYQNFDEEGCCDWDYPSEVYSLKDEEDYRGESIEELFEILRDPA